MTSAYSPYVIIILRNKHAANCLRMTYVYVYFQIMCRYENSSYETIRVQTLLLNQDWIHNI
jgi:hypothetical protein